MSKKSHWFIATESVGVRRLSLTGGVVAASYRFFNPNSYENSLAGWSRLSDIAVYCLLYFLGAWVSTRLVAWIASGFISDIRKKET
jgi:hypothetical protein